MSNDRRIGLDELSFCGAADYLDAQPQVTEAQPRVYVKFRPSGAEQSFLALLDTGAHYCILAREILATIEDHLTEHIGSRTLKTAHGVLRGDLYIHPMTLVSEAGQHLELEAIVLAAPEWQGPSFLGYLGFLDRIQFAIHPGTNRLFFGPAF